MSRIERFHPGTKVIEWLSGSISGPASTYSSGAGYFAGGLGLNAGTIMDTIDKLVFGSETCAAISATLSTAKRDCGGMSNNGTAGYIGGGYTNTQIDTVEKLTTPGESRTTLGTGLSVARREQPAGCANSGTAGYFGGGNENTDWSSGSFAIDKFAFSNDSRSVVSDGLSVKVRAPGAMANSGTAGYWAGGSPNGPTSAVIDKIAFSNDTRTVLSTGLSEAMYGPAGCANSGTAGYIGGGYAPPAHLYQVDIIAKWAFSNDARTVLSTVLSSERQAPGAAAQSGTAGYWAGGSTGTRVTTVDKLAFSNDSLTTLGTGLSTTLQHLSGAANSGTL